MNLPPTLVDEYTFELIYEVLEKLPPNARIVELGSFLGGSIIRIANKLKELNKTKDITLIAIDNWLCENISYESKVWANVQSNFYDEFKQNLEDSGHKDLVVPFASDSITAALLHDRDSVDLLFVDDGHTYPHTKNVLEEWLPKVKSGGYIIGHDFSTNGVEMAVNEVLGTNVGFCQTRSAYIYQKC